MDSQGAGAPDALAGPLVVLLSTGRVAAEATAERLLELGIEARVHGLPNVFVRLASGGNYRVQVIVPEADLARARAELEQWAVEAAPRVRVLAREVQRVLGALTLAALGLGGLLLWLGVPFALLWGVAFWLAATAHWTWRSRLRHPLGGSGPGASRE
jgi:hypothetical protein